MAMNEKPVKSIILYATKYGAAREIARRMSEHIEGAETCDLGRDAVPDLAGYGRVIVGSSVYAGRIRKEAKVFLSRNAENLRGKELGFYISGMGTEKEAETLSSAYPGDLLQGAKAAAVLGGIFDPGKAGAFERFIMKIVTKHKAYIDTIDDGKIKEFAKSMTDG